MDCSPPGPSVHGIFQARVLEWDAIAFSVSDIRIHYSKVSLFPHTLTEQLLYEQKKNHLGNQKKNFNYENFIQGLEYPLLL